MITHLSTYNQHQRIMKRPAIKPYALIGFFLVFLCLAMVRPVASQSGAEKLYTSKKEMIEENSLSQLLSLEAALARIENTYNVSFLYDSKLVEGKMVSFSLFRSDSLASLLAEVLTDHGLAWERETERTYILVPRSQSRILFRKKIQVETVRGTVTDGSTGETLPGVNIIVKGTTTGTSSGTDGRYELTVPSLNDTLVFSFIGFQTQEIPIDGRTEINVAMVPETVEGEELVVVGYGTQKKESMVAAISTISSEEIVQTPTSNLNAGLSGKMPGLTIMMKDGELGRENIQTLIRGQATVNDAQPLILVDGIEREISTLSPYDVESISILKDASATAVFGVRGANGVILITTKKGVEGKPRISANTNFSIQRPTRLPEPMSALEYVTTRNSVIQQNNETTGQNIPLPYSDQIIDYYRNGYDPSQHPSYFPEVWVDRNFFDELMYDFTPMYKGNVNIRGGNEKTKYYASVGYMSQGGPFKTQVWDEYNWDNQQRLDRFTYRANVDMQVTDDLKAWVNLSGYLQDKNDPIIFGANPSSATTASYYFLQLAAFTDIPAISYPDLNSQGQVVSVPGKDRTPYGNLNRTGYRTMTSNRINTTVGAEYNLDFFTKGLSAKAILAYDPQATHIRGFRRTYQTYIQQIDQQADSLTYVPGAGNSTELNQALTQSFTNRVDLEASLNYNRTFGDHDVTGLLLYKQNQRVVNTAVPFNYLGVVGRLTYGYAGKYLAEVNFGYNGSEQFAPGNRFGFFPSFSAGWVLSEESFMESIRALDYLKIRASYGQVGNDRISNTRFIYLGNWTQGGGGYFQGIGSGVPGLPAPVHQNSIPNEDVTWEVANKYNVGIESSFPNGIDVDVDLFYEKRNSILIANAPIPAHMFGQLNLPPTNDGVMVNKGFETTLGYSKQVSNDLFLSARFSTSFARNEMKNMNETPLDDSFAYPFRQEGFSRGTPFGFESLGYFEDQEEIDDWADQTGLGAQVLPGDLKYKDQNQDGVIDEKDYVPMEHPNTPEMNMSLSLSANYKAFDFSVLFHAVNSYTFNMAGRAIFDWHGNDYGGIKNYFEHHKYAWTAEKAANGGDIRYPRLHPNGVSVSKQPSDYWMISLRYLRLQNLEFGYTLPTNLSSQLGMKKARIYFNGANLALWDNMPYKYLDPEVSNSLSHPILATYNVGLNITF